MRYAGTILLFLLSVVGYAQLKTRAIETAPQIQHGKFQADILPATLPFWDDFSLSNRVVDSVRVWGMDSLAQWEFSVSQHVFINSTLAINPPSYNVATFDGLDANGNVYQQDDDAIGLADQLESDTINLGAKTEADNIYLSFFWQAGGNVEKPEAGDSLVLQFLDENRDWQTVWFMEGGENLDETAFTSQFILIEEAFLSENFKFRFQSYGDLDGPFDAWHVDWIYINEGRTNNTNGFLDRAFSGDLTSPLSPFQSIPINQFNIDNRFITNQRIEVSNLDATDLYPIDVAYRLVNTIDDNVLITDSDRAYAVLFPSERDTITLLDADLVPIDLADVDFSSITGYDSVVLQTEISLKSNDGVLDGTVVDLRVNDTIRQHYTLHNYYAYDDGTAEFAAGTNIRNGQVAVEFWVEQPDTLTHIDFYFPNISPFSQSTPTLELRILTALSDTTQLRSQQITVMGSPALNTFVRYALERPAVVTDTFYVAYKQFINDYIGIGFDRSNPDASGHIYENLDGDWIQNVSLQGALMIRPVFKEGEEFILSVDEPEVTLNIYPNPSNGTISVSGEYDRIELLDLSGRKLSTQSRQPVHDLTKFPQGLYLLRVYYKQTHQTQKIILK